MLIHFKLGAVRALTIEWSAEFGFTPLFKKTSYRCETILDMPYTQAIYTGGNWTPLKRAAVNDDEKTEKTTGGARGAGAGR